MGEDGHGAVEAVAAGGTGAAGEVDAEGEVVGVGVRGGGGVCDCVGEACSHCLVIGRIWMWGKVEMYSSFRSSP